MGGSVRDVQAECGRSARDAVRAGDRADLPRECAIVPIVPIPRETIHRPRRASLAHALPKSSLPLVCYTGTTSSRTVNKKFAGRTLRVKRREEDKNGTVVKRGFDWILREVMVS